MNDKYCGICGATTGLKYHKTLPDGERCFICKDEKICAKRSTMKDIVELERAEMAYPPKRKKTKRKKILCINDGCKFKSKRDTCKQPKFSKICNTRISDNMSWPPRSCPRPNEERLRKARLYCGIR